MKIPSKAELPLRAKDQIIEMDEAKLAQFRKAFGGSKKYNPPTAYAISMTGVFELVNQFGVDWRNLLHASQKFTYLKALEVPSKLRAETQLVDAKFRAGFHWLNFEIKVFDTKDSSLLATSKSLLMVKENQA